MITRNVGENFKVMLSTKKTLFGAASDEFSVYYADINDLTTKTEIPGGATEAIVPIADGDEHTATLTAPVAYGSRLLYVDGANSTLEEGDTIEYASGKYAYVMKIVGDKVYLKTPVKAALVSGTTVTQVGNTGEYTTSDISIGGAGEYIVAIEGSDYGILVEQRVKVVDPDAGQSNDPDAPDETVAVAY